MPKRKWIVVPYRTEWPAMFRTEAEILGEIFRGTEARIEHIGSTSVPGLGAKPIIDIMPGVSRLEEAEERIGALEAIGYEYVPDFEDQLPERRYFRKPVGLPRTHHLHIVEVGCPFWQSHLLFRDHLRSHPETARDYYELKVRLAHECNETGADYTDRKTAFIQGVLRTATGGEKQEQPPD